MTFVWPTLMISQSLNASEQIVCMPFWVLILYKLTEHMNADMRKKREVLVSQKLMQKLRINFDWPYLFPLYITMEKMY